MKMAHSEHAATAGSQDRTDTARKRSEEGEDFNDLPIHFHPSGKVEKRISGALNIPKSPMELSGRGGSSRPVLTDASTQYFEHSRLLAPRYPPPSSQGNKVDSGCQYSPNDIAAVLYPTPGLVSNLGAPPADLGAHLYPPGPFATAAASHSLKDRQFFAPSSNFGLSQAVAANGRFYGLGPQVHNSLGKSPYDLPGVSSAGAGVASSAAAAAISGMYSFPGFGMNNGDIARNSALFAATSSSPSSSSHSPGRAGSGGGGVGAEHRLGDGQHSGERVAASTNTAGLQQGSQCDTLGGLERGGVSKSGGGGATGGGESNGKSPAAAAKPYQCPECEATFTRVDHLSRHLRTQRSHFHSALTEKGSVGTPSSSSSPSSSQTPGQYHACPHCNKLFTRRDHMKRHSKIHLRGEPVRCVECQMWFPTKGELNRHLLSAHNIQVFECSHCGKGFLQADFLTRHLREKHGLSDSIGGLSVSQNGTGQRDGCSSPLEASYRCGICMLSFATELDSISHMMIHTRDADDPVTALPLAANQQAEPSARDVTAVSHSLAQMYSSLHHLPPDADIGLNGNSPLLTTPQFQPQHQHQHQQQNQHQHQQNGAYVGNVLSAAQQQPYYDARMGVSVEGNREIKAEPCDAIYARNHGSAGTRPGPESGEVGRGEHHNNSSSHHHIHRHHQGAQTTNGLAHLTSVPTAKRPFVCGVCGLGFPRAPSLKIHLRKHCGHRPFHCMECGATFASSSNLIRHQRTHSGERPFRCQQCSAAFTHKGALVNHERVHTGQRPYVCDLCGAAFARCDALSRHKKTHKENRIKMEQEGGMGDHLFSLHSAR